jgi:hypothetical protein
MRSHGQPPHSESSTNPRRMCPEVRYLAQPLWSPSRMEFDIKQKFGGGDRQSLEGNPSEGKPSSSQNVLQDLVETVLDKQTTTWIFKQQSEDLRSVPQWRRRRVRLLAGRPARLFWPLTPSTYPRCFAAMTEVIPLSASCSIRPSNPVSFFKPRSGGARGAPHS